MHYFRLVWLRRRASLKSELMWMWKCSSMKKVLNRCIYEQLHCFKRLGVIWEFEHFWLRCFQSTWKTISITISQDSLHACDSWICFFPDITEQTTIHTNTYRVMINLTFFFLSLVLWEYLEKTHAGAAITCKLHTNIRLGKYVLAKTPRPTVSLVTSTRWTLTKTRYFNLVELLLCASSSQNWPTLLSWLQLSKCDFHLC